MPTSGRSPSFFPALFRPMSDFVTPAFVALEQLIPLAWPEVTSVARMSFAGWVSWKDWLLRGLIVSPFVHILEGEVRATSEYGLSVDRRLVSVSVLYVRRRELTASELTAGATSVADLIQARLQILADGLLSSGLQVIEYPTCTTSAGLEVNRILQETRDDLYIGQISFNLLVGDLTN